MRLHWTPRRVYLSTGLTGGAFIGASRVAYRTAYTFLSGLFFLIILAIWAYIWLVVICAWILAEIAWLAGQVVWMGVLLIRHKQFSARWLVQRRVELPPFIQLDIQVRSG